MQNVLGERIRALRVESGMTQEELAEMIRVSNTTLSQYETGARIPSDAVKIKIAEIFQVSVDYLIGFSHTRNHPKKEPATGKGDGSSDIDRRIRDLLSLVPEEKKPALYEMFEAALKMQGLIP